MNQRRSFLRNITLAIAASLLPKILQPIASEIEEESYTYYVDSAKGMLFTWRDGQLNSHIINNQT